ncbi:hypothetical protein, partial [Rhizobium sp. BK456]|uniref:hypothetical protein n=1 Tax=Rhizobium sp. BK456 TaxID=2587007 RepID=UPI001AEEE788
MFIAQDEDLDWRVMLYCLWLIRDVSDMMPPREVCHVRLRLNLPFDCGHLVLPRLLVLPGSRRRQRLCRPPLRC